MTPDQKDDLRQAVRRGLAHWSRSKNLVASDVLMSELIPTVDTMLALERAEVQRWRTVQELADEVGCSKMTLYRAIHEGRLPAVNLNEQAFRVRQADWLAYLRAQ